MPKIAKLNTAMILAAGIGSRMLGSIEHPKSMIKLGNSSLIERILNNLYENGISRFVINTHYKAEILENHVKNLNIFQKAEILFSREEELLETAGGTKNALHLINADQFFVLNTDVFWPTKKISAIQTLMSNWQPNEMDSLLLLLNKEKAIGYEGTGDFDLAEKNILNVTNTSRDFVYIGMQIIKSSLLTNIPEGKLSFSHLWKSKITKNGDIERIYGSIFDGEWLHIGTPEGKKEAENYFMKMNQ